MSMVTNERNGMIYAAKINKMVARLTAFKSLEAMCEAKGYVPSLYGSPARKELADAYDAKQAERGDPRRAFRG